MGLFTVVSIFIGIVFLILLVQIARGVAEWAHNNSLPVESVPARVVTKRTETRGNAPAHSRGHVWTNYFATFEMDSGERLEFGLYGKDYGLLVEGDRGTLSYQGTRYHGFERQR